MMTSASTIKQHVKIRPPNSLAWKESVFDLLRLNQHLRQKETEGGQHVHTLGQWPHVAPCGQKPNLRPLRGHDLFSGVCHLDAQSLGPRPVLAQAKTIIGVIAHLEEGEDDEEGEAHDVRHNQGHVGVEFDDRTPLPPSPWQLVVATAEAYGPVQQVRLRGQCACAVPPRGQGIEEDATTKDSDRPTGSSLHPHSTTNSSSSSSNLCIQNILVF